MRSDVAIDVPSAATKKILVPTAAKYSLPQRWQILGRRFQFLESSD